jgi:hypothetical protein
MTFFNNKLWLAWRTGLYYEDGNTVIASIDPTNIRFDGPPCTYDVSPCSDSSQCRSEICSAGVCSSLTLLPNARPPEKNDPQARNPN